MFFNGAITLKVIDCPPRSYIRAHDFGVLLSLTIVRVAFGHMKFKVNGSFGK